MVVNRIKKSVFLLVVLMLSGVFAKAQNPSFEQLLSILSAKFPEKNISSKVIAFASWSAADAKSREVNREFDRVTSIYQGAKLKNGTYGDIFISCSVDNASTATIAATKDGISFAIRVNKSDFSFLSTIPASGNVVYDATGAKVYENLAKEDVFMSFNKLITR